MMSSHVQFPVTFTLTDAQNDATFVLVLIEATGIINNYWNDVKTQYLSALLGTLRASSKDRPIRVCWQLTSDPPGYTYNETQGQIPDFRFDQAANYPITSAAIRRGLESIKKAPREQGWTRHLIIVGVSPPFPSEGSTNPHEPSMVSETCQSMAAVLAQERIRTHMVLSAAPYMQPLRDLHSCQLGYQHTTEIRPWFPVNSDMFTIHITPQPFFHDSAMERRTRAQLILQRNSNPVTPTSTTPPVLIPSPTHETPSHSLSPSPPSRRTRLRTGSSSSPPSPPSDRPGGLVSYLQKMHGLSNKRKPPSKVTKRSSTNDMSSRPSTSSRPILPKLTMPPQTTASARPSDVSAAQKAATELEGSRANSTSPSSNMYSAGGPAVTQTQGGTASDAAQNGYSHVRWPFLKAQPLAMVDQGPGFGESANAALRSLEAISPRPPGMGLPFTDDPRFAPNNAPTGMYIGPSGTQDTVSQQYQQYPPYNPYGGASSPQHRTPPMGFPPGSGYPLLLSNPSYTNTYQQQGYMPRNSSPQPQGSPPSHMQLHPQSMHANAGPHGSPISQPPQMTYPLEPFNYPPQMVQGHPYGVSPTASQSTTPLPSPSVTAPIAQVDEGENQPFVVTPEYEAFANAQFEEAVRSGAMQASMTGPAGMSPGMANALAGSNGYFTGQVAPQQDLLSQSNYTYPGSQHDMQNQHLYQQQQQPGPPMSDADPAHYYHSPSESSAPQQPWYGP